MNKMNKGFTLAEVLITLVIIGVIGALTVPSLIQNTQKQEYVSALKKTYSTLSQAAQAIIAEEGSPKSSCETCDDGWASSGEEVYKQFKKHLNIVKDCGTAGGCFGSGRYKHLSLKQIDNGNWNTRGETHKIVTADGAAIGFWKSGNNIVVDINGAKGPNIFGRDFFWFLITENGIIPRGCTDGSVDICDASNGNGIGEGCACKVLREGAMNY